MIEFFTNHWDELALAVTGLITFASVVVKFTPTPKDDAILAKIIQVFEVISLNKKK